MDREFNDDLEFDFDWDFERQEELLCEAEDLKAERRAAKRESDWDNREY